MMETGRSRIGKPRTRLGMSTGGRARRPGNPNVVANCFDHDGYPYAIVINKVETGKWDVSGFGKYRLYRGQLTGKLLDDFGTAFAQATAEKRLKLCDTIKEVDGAKIRFLALSFGVIKNKSITTPSMVFGVKEVGIGAAHKTQKVAKLAPDVFSNFQLEKVQCDDCAVLDVPFEGKGMYRDDGQYQLLYDAESKIFYVFDGFEWFGVGIAKSNRALLRDLFSPSEKLLVTITRAEGFHANESDDRLFIGRGVNALILYGLSPDERVHAVAKYRPESKAVFDVPLAANEFCATVKEITDGSFSSETSRSSDSSSNSNLSFASANVLPDKAGDTFTFVVDYTNMIPTFSVNKRTRCTRQGLLILDSNTLFFRNAHYRWYYRVLTDGFDFAAEKEFAKALISETVADLELSWYGNSLPEEAVGLTAACKKLCNNEELPGIMIVREYEYQLRLVSTRVGQILEKRYEEEVVEMWRFKRADYVKRNSAGDGSASGSASRKRPFNDRTNDQEDDF